jgi:hypothetical protein
MVTSLAPMEADACVHLAECSLPPPHAGKRLSLHEDVDTVPEHTGMSAHKFRAHIHPHYGHRAQDSWALDCVLLSYGDMLSSHWRYGEGVRASWARGGEPSAKEAGE